MERSGRITNNSSCQENTLGGWRGRAKRGTTATNVRTRSGNRAGCDGRGQRAGGDRRGGRDGGERARRAGRAGRADRGDRGGAGAAGAAACLDFDRRCAVVDWYGAEPQAGGGGGD